MQRNQKETVVMAFLDRKTDVFHSIVEIGKLVFLPVIRLIDKIEMQWMKADYHSVWYWIDWLMKSDFSNNMENRTHVVCLHSWENLLDFINFNSNPLIACNCLNPIIPCNLSKSSSHHKIYYRFVDWFYNNLWIIILLLIMLEIITYTR